MPRLAIVFVALVALFSIVGCATSDLPNGNVPNDAGVWEGSFSAGFETVAFKPCGIAEQWWVTGGEGFQDLSARYGAATSVPYTAVHVRVRGNASAKGSFGHLGAYQREFQVTQVAELRATQTGDCK